MSTADPLNGTAPPPDVSASAIGPESLNPNRLKRFSAFFVRSNSATFASKTKFAQVGGSGPCSMEVQDFDFHGFHRILDGRLRKLRGVYVM